MIARYTRRARGDDVLFLMGNDEHSQNVDQRAAREKGIDPLAYCDQMEAVFREAWSRAQTAPSTFSSGRPEKRHQTGRSRRS